MTRFFQALLWGLIIMLAGTPTEAQNLPAFTQFAGCITALDNSFTTGGFGRLRCDASGNLMISGAGSVTSNGALQPPTAPAGKIVQTSVSVLANTSTQLTGANAQRIAIEIQCDGTSTVGIDRTGGVLASVAASPLVVPSGSYPLYTMPIATLTAVTAYAGTAQTCRVTEYNR